MTGAILIGQLAKASSCKVQTIRYYEKIGLLPKPLRSSGNQRVYLSDHLDRLIFIRHCRALGFSLDQIRKLLHLAGDSDKSCGEVDQIAKVHLVEVEEKIKHLEGLRQELRRIIDGCKVDKVDQCQILKALGDHGQCIAKEHGGSDI
ncbi:MAG: helix-turn-helix domain-containing protein [Magnetococcales bacterium]|nr:helix-turn-helix domain-containing protein [Magnetococcales bacterium]